MRRHISLLLICLLLSACSTNQKYHTIDTNKATELINNGAIVIDVRTVDEYNREHIENAINIPLDQIATTNFDKDLTIIVYCQTGIRSEEAAKILAENGYTSLYNLDGGLLNWGGELVQ